LGLSALKHATEGLLKHGLSEGIPHHRDASRLDRELIHLKQTDLVEGAGEDVNDVGVLRAALYIIIIIINNNSIILIEYSVIR
jgi:hypothetical protein